MTKAQFETLRDNNLGDTAPSSPSTPLRDPVCDRTIFDTIVSELFSAVHENIYNSGTETGDILTHVATNFAYGLTLKKVGNIVHIKGFIDSSAGTNAAGTIINIISSEFNAKTLPSGNFQYIFERKDYAWSSASPLSQTIHKLYVEGNTIKSAFTMTSPARFFIDSFYFTND